MSFVNFLMENYTWILIILAVVIITVIGYLADKRNKRRKKDNKVGEAKEEMEPVGVVAQPLTEQATIPKPSIEQVSQMGKEISVPKPVMAEEIKKVPVVLGPEVTGSTVQPAYHPLSNQKPQFEQTNMETPSVSPVSTTIDNNVANQTPPMWMPDNPGASAPVVNNNVVEPTPTITMPSEPFEETLLVNNNMADQPIIMPNTNNMNIESTSTLGVNQNVGQPTTITPMDAKPVVTEPIKPSVAPTINEIQANDPLMGASIVMGDRTIGPEVTVQQANETMTTQGPPSQTAEKIIDDEMWKL